MLKVGIIVGDTRPGRKAAATAKWAHDILKTRKDAEFEMADIKDYKLPLLDEPVPPIIHEYSKPHTKAWSEKIALLDAHIFVTPEYNHGTSAALKNAIDFLHTEWNKQSGRIYRVWRRWRCSSCRELEAGDGQTQSRGRTSPGVAFDVYRLREFYDL
jgi:NAD(P)H-dependent FMN reductase